MLAEYVTECIIRATEIDCAEKKSDFKTMGLSVM
jgi:hypothetical protein